MTTSLLNVTAPGAVLFVAVSLDITHTFDGDLLLSLTPPGTPAITLSNRRGDTGDNYTGTIFSDLAPAPITSGIAPFTGGFRPEQLLNGAFGLPALGDWALTVSDLASIDTGTLDNFTLHMCVCTACETTCGDFVDNDGDMLIDCADPDCSFAPACP